MARVEFPQSLYKEIDLTQESLQVRFQSMSHNVQTFSDLAWAFKSLAHYPYRNVLNGNHYLIFKEMTSANPRLPVIVNLLGCPAGRYTGYLRKILTRIYFLERNCPPAPKGALGKYVAKHSLIPKSHITLLEEWYKVAGCSSLSSRDLHGAPEILRRVQNLAKKFPPPKDLAAILLGMKNLLEGDLRYIPLPDKEKVEPPGVVLPVKEDFRGSTLNERVAWVQKSLDTFKSKVSLKIDDEILNIVTKLGTKDQFTFRGYFVEGMGQIELARYAGLSQGAVSHRLTRIVKRIAFRMQFPGYTHPVLLEMLKEVYPSPEAREKYNIPGRTVPDILAWHLSNSCKQTATAERFQMNQCAVSSFMTNLQNRINKLVLLDRVKWGRHKEFVDAIIADGYIYQDVELPHFQWKSKKVAKAGFNPTEYTTDPKVNPWSRKSREFTKVCKG